MLSPFAIAYIAGIFISGVPLLAMVMIINGDKDAKMPDRMTNLILFSWSILWPIFIPGVVIVVIFAFVKFVVKSIIKKRSDFMGIQMVFPGSIVKEYLEQNNITQKILADKSGISEESISNVLNGNSILTEDFALALEKVIPEVPASYWLNYESKYREYLARNKSNH